MEKKISVCLGLERGPEDEELRHGVAKGLNNVTFPEQTKCKEKRTLLSGVYFPGPVAGAQPIRFPKDGPARAERNCSSPRALALRAVVLSTLAREPQGCPTAFRLGSGPALWPSHAASPCAAR